MSKNHKALFVTNPTTFKSEVTGGVQMCSQEFYDLIEKCGFNVEPYFIPFTKRIIDRFRIKFKLDSYNFFDIAKQATLLISYIKMKEVTWVFLNLASTIRFAKPIKEAFGDTVKVVLLSHGNDSGDFLHVTTKPIGNYNFWRKTRDITRLGFLLHTESAFRVNYLDAVLTVSETEAQIENWLGAKVCMFIPRTIKDKPLVLNQKFNRAGFVGRLDHAPNYHGITLLLEELSKIERTDLEIRLVGAPNDWGKKITKKYAFVTYLGELSDEDLATEVSTWALFINPVFWFSMGVTTKVAKAIGWGVPIITTTAGLRGYKWNKGNLLVAETPNQMANEIVALSGNQSQIVHLVEQVKQVRNSCYSLEELADRVSKKLEEI